MTNECMGCISVATNAYDAVTPECIYTISGVKDLLECPCKECLVKVMCKRKCTAFIVNKFRSINKDRGTPRIKPYEVYSNNQNKFRVALYKKGWIKKGWIKSNT